MGKVWPSVLVLTPDPSPCNRDNSATVHTVRYVRPRFLPLVGLAFPVTTKLRFHPDGEGPSSLSSSNAQPLYVTSLEDQWPLDSYVKGLPVIGSL